MRRGTAHSRKSPQESPKKCDALRPSLASQVPVFLLVIYSWIHHWKLLGAQRRLEAARLARPRTPSARDVAEPEWATINDTRLETRRLKALHDLEREQSSAYPRGSRDEKEECCFCIETFRAGQAVRTLGCGHFFHSSCLERWLLDAQAFRQRSCPICKADPLARPTSPAVEAPAHAGVAELGGALNAAEGADPAAETRTRAHSLPASSSLRAPTEADARSASAPSLPTDGLTLRMMGAWFARTVSLPATPRASVLVAPAPTPPPGTVLGRPPARVRQTVAAAPLTQEARRALRAFARARGLSSSRDIESVVEL